MQTSIQKTTAVVVALMAVAGAARATLYTDSSSPDEAVPEGNPIGIASSLDISDIPTTINGDSATIQDVTVNLTISGGYNGDLYGYLVFQPTGGGAQMITLLNQIGTGPSNPFGSATSGMSVTLSDSGSTDIHAATGTAGQSLSGTYTPDAPGGQTFDNTFSGTADGTWTLFLSDLSDGAGTSILTSWGVGISVVPEPVTWALAGFAGILAVSGIRRYLKVTKVQA